MLLEKNDYEHAANKTDMITGHIKELRGVLKYNETMADPTSWRAGGSADHYFEPADLEDLITYLKSVPVHDPLLSTASALSYCSRNRCLLGTVIALNRA